MKNIGFIQSMNAGRLNSLLIILAITILSYEATDLFYKIISFPLMKQTAIVQGNGISSIKDSRQFHQLEDYVVIIERNLFRTTLKVAGGSESGGVFDSEQKNIDFDLRGTVASNSAFGFAVLEERGTNKQKLYRLGDKVGSGKLTRITRNTVTLKNGDQETTLKIKETVEGALLPNTPAAPRNAGRAGMPAFGRQAVNERSGSLESIMNQAVVRPFLSKGVREGYLITNIAPNSIYAKAGLQNGDVIVDINNNQMQNANDILQVLNSLQSGSKIQLNIKRRGKNETINYSLD